MVSEKVNLTYFDVYLPQTMWNHTKKINERAQTTNYSVLQREVGDALELFAKNEDNKEN